MNKAFEYFMYVLTGAIGYLLGLKVNDLYKGAGVSSELTATIGLLLMAIGITMLAREKNRNKNNEKDE